MPSRGFLVLPLTILFLGLVCPSGATAQRRHMELSPVSLHGRVLDESGRPPEDLVQVDLICSGRIRKQTLTSPDGTFSFDMDVANSEDWLDPGAGGSVPGAMEGTARVAPPGRSPRLDEVPSMGRGRISLSGCEIRVAPRPGFESNVIRLRTRSSSDNPDVGTLIVRRMSNSNATMVSLATLMAPQKAREAFERAQQQLSSTPSNLGRAISDLESAVEEFPEFSAAWDLLARAYLSRGQEEKGREAFLRAVESEPALIPPYVGLAQLGVQMGNWPEVVQWSEKILKLDTRHTQALFWKGLSHFYLKQFEQAEQVLSALYDMGQSKAFPFGLLLLGVIHANQGRIQDAAEELQLYLSLMPPEEVPEGQREELEQQLSRWYAEGLATPSQESEAQASGP